MKRIAYLATAAYLAVGELTVALAQANLPGGLGGGAGFVGAAGAQTPEAVVNRIGNILVSGLVLAVLALIMIFAIGKTAASAIRDGRGNWGPVVIVGCCMTAMVCLGYIVAAFTGGANIGGSLGTGIGTF
jgi:hypothetical protein